MEVLFDEVKKASLDITRNHRSQKDTKNILPKFSINCMFNECSQKTSEGCNVDFQLRGKRNVYAHDISVFSFQFMCVKF